MIKELIRSANRGDAKAQNDLGVCYERGLDVPQDYSKAVEYYKKSAAQGEATALCNLGLCYEYGRGVNQDFYKAAQCYKKAADQGDAIAQNNLGACYECGLGVPQDYSKAIEYYKKAAKQGEKNAIKNLALHGEGEIKKPSQEKETLTSIKMLDELIGLNNIKRQINRLKSSLIKNKNRALNLHMLFTGNPGTGKTVVARIIANILYETGVLPTNKLVEVSKRDLIGAYIGQTEPKVNNVVDSALGGVLFIDEAYSLYVSESPSDYGHVVISELIARMENDRGKFVVILAGYKDETNKMIESNPGFKSRIQMSFDFQDYSEKELIEIAGIFLKKAGYTMDKNALNLMIEVIEKLKEHPSYANAREVRKFIDGVILIQNENTVADRSDFNITLRDVRTYIDENNYNQLLETPKVSWPVLEKEKLIKSYKANIKHNYNENLSELNNRIIAIDNGGYESTGFIINKDGYALTCARSVRNSQEVNVALTLNVGNKKIDFSTKAIVVKVDEGNDVALIKINSVISEFDYFSLSQEPISIRQSVILPGYVWGQSTIPTITIFDGKVTNLDRNKIYLDISGKSGQLGSPVINKDTNEVIGVYLGANSRTRNRVIEEMNWATNISEVWDMFL